MIGRFASKEFREEDDFNEVVEWPLFYPCVGLRFTHIHIRLTREDYASPHVHQWIQYMFTRVDRLGKTPVVITVLA